MTYHSLRIDANKSSSILFQWNQYIKPVPDHLPIQTDSDRIKISTEVENLIGFIIEVYIASLKDNIKVRCNIKLLWANQYILPREKNALCKSLVFSFQLLRRFVQSMLDQGRLEFTPS